MKRCYGETLPKNWEYEVFKLKEHKSAACRVRKYSDGTLDLVSYNTLVVRATKIPSGYQIECSGTYSATTRKHIGWFLRAYFPMLSYYDLNGIANSDESIIVEC